MEKPAYWKEKQHTMARRSDFHNYSRPGVYHITMSVAESAGHPLGTVAGSLEIENGKEGAPHVELTPLGAIIKEELLHSIRKHYPMTELQDFVVMPEHLHFLLVVHQSLVSQNGRPSHLGHIIAGFKQGCNRRYWQLLGLIGSSQAQGQAQEAAPKEEAQEAPKAAQEAPKAAQEAMPKAAKEAAAAAATIAATKSPLTLQAGAEASVLGDLVAEKSNLPPLFSPGYCDVMPVDAAQLATQRAYIQNNPRSRLLRTLKRSLLQPRRAALDTLVSLPALQGYLRRVCPPSQLQPAALANLAKRLQAQGNHIVCDSYGDSALLDRRLLPVVCHRNDAALFEQQKAHCLAEAAAGAVLVSARIARGEQEIIDTALTSGFPVVRILDNGFPELYHPSASDIDDCAASNLLILTPWHYEFRPHAESLSVAFCKTMNCIVQAICRIKDDWWKEAPSS